MKRPCLGCGRVLEVIPTPTRRHRSSRRPVVEAWIEANGYVCPGYLRPPHGALNLTADHIVPESLGGQMLSVLCAGCNSRKKDALRCPSCLGVTSQA